MPAQPAASMPNPNQNPNPDHLQRIRRTSRVMLRMCQALIIFLPISLVIYWATQSAPELASQANLPIGKLQAPLQPWHRVAGALVSGVPLALLLAGIWQAKQCFEQFAQGQVFTTQAVRRLRRMAGWVALAALAAIVAGAVLSVVFTINNAPGTRQLAVGISSNHLATAFFAAIVWLMADVIGQGQALAEENQQFI